MAQNSILSSLHLFCRSFSLLAIYRTSLLSSSWPVEVTNLLERCQLEYIRFFLAISSQQFSLIHMFGSVSSALSSRIQEKEFLFSFFIFLCVNPEGVVGAAFFGSLWNGYVYMGFGHNPQIMWDSVQVSDLDLDSGPEFWLLVCCGAYRIVN